MDIFRLPKFSYYFYRSQRDASATSDRWQGGPVVFIASHWTPASDLRVIVFSNCDEIELLLNGVSVSRQKPTKAWMTQYLPHAPFVFELSAFAAGSLEARGFIGGPCVATHLVRTPGAPTRLKLEIETLDMAAAPTETDVLLSHASILDGRDTLCLNDTSLVAFTIEGGAEIVGPSTIAAEAGIASIVIRVPASCRSFKLSATRTSSEGTFTASSAWQYPTLSGRSQPLEEKPLPLPSGSRA
jgi:beta-galactosidase